MDGQRLIDLADSIDVVPNFYSISDELTEIGAMLNADARVRFPTDTGRRHAFIYGALLTLRSLYGWDVQDKTDLQEEQILWMFAYLFAYRT